MGKVKFSRISLFDDQVQKKALFSENVEIASV